MLNKFRSRVKETKKHRKQKKVTNRNSNFKLLHSTSILECLKGQKLERLELYIQTAALSPILMAVPATQGSVERVFFNLAFIYFFIQIQNISF